MASDRVNKFLKERTTLRTWLTSIIVAIFGGLLLICSEITIWWTWKGGQSVQSVVRDIGSLLIASVAIALLWELIGKRAFLDELLPKVRLSEDIVTSGITGFKNSFYHEIEWDSLFQNVKNLDILYMYGVTWNRVHLEHIKHAVSRHAQIRVVVPDPNDKLILSEIARHDENDEMQVKANIEQTIMYFQKLQKEGAKISIWLQQAVPVYSLFRFDDTVVMSLYSQRRGELFIGPALLLERGGMLFKFVEDDFSAIISNKNNLARLVN